MKLKASHSITCIPLILLIFASCGETLPKDKFIFDTKFDSLYKAVSNKDTIFFENSYNGIDTFVLTKVDSIIFNKVNCFMCPRAGKSIFRNYKQYPINYWADSTLDQNTGKKIEREVSLITVSKVPDANLSEAYIEFKNFHCTLLGSLGLPFNDTLKLNGRFFTNYYVLKSTAPSLIVNNDDVETVFVTLNDGIIAYKEKSGILRRRLM